MGDVVVSGSIREKIAWARKTNERLADVLFHHHDTRRLFFDFEQAAARSRAAMEQQGLPERCRICEELEGGSCCGVGIENRYDGYLLLINLVLGVDLPTEPKDRKSCFFLSPNGCCLKARHVICINYLCKDVLHRVEPSALANLRAVEGEEINLLFHLHERIKKIVRETGKPGFRMHDTQ
jgi:hypothetical protein